MQFAESKRERERGKVGCINRGNAFDFSVKSTMYRNYHLKEKFSLISVKLQIAHMNSSVHDSQKINSSPDNMTMVTITTTRKKIDLNITFAAFAIWKQLIYDYASVITSSAHRFEMVTIR